MIGQHLRQYSTNELAWRQQVLAWQMQGFAIQQRISPGERLLHFRSDAGWEGMVDLRNWFNRVMPQCSGLSNHAWPIEQLEALFVNCDQPIEGLPDELAYQRLDSMGIVERSQIPHSMYSCLTPNGWVWLYDFPGEVALKQTTGQFEVSGLPVDIHFSIGHSFISIVLLKKVQQGDVLLITDDHNLIVSEGNILGGFLRNEEGLMYQDNDINLGDPTDNAAAEVQQNNELQPLVPRDKIMIKINFILQRSRMSIAELESLYQGKVLPCHFEAEKNMLITANDVVIAKGEVVWIEDRMGVEVKEIYQEVSDGSR